MYSIVKGDPKATGVMVNSPPNIPVQSTTNCEKKPTLLGAFWCGDGLRSPRLAGGLSCSPSLALLQRGQRKAQTCPGHRAERTPTGAGWAGTVPEIGILEARGRRSKASRIAPDVLVSPRKFNDLHRRGLGMEDFQKIFKISIRDLNCKKLF